MKRLLLFLLIIASLGSIRLAAWEKANTVLIHPGETIYARFEQKGKKLKLISAGKEKEAAAQVIFSFTRGGKNGGITLKVENNFSDDLLYEAELRSLTLKRHMPARVFPVVGGKMSTEEFPPAIEEVALFGFRFDPQTPVEKEKE